MTSKENISMITIETNRLLLRNYRVTDFEDIIKYFSDEEISKFLQIVADNGYNEHFH